MKISLLLIALCSIQAGAQTVELPLAGKLDLGKVVSAMRADYVYALKPTQRLAGAHIPLASLTDTKGMELLNVNGGMIWDTSNGVGGPFMALGGRLDNISSWLRGKEWLTRRISFIALPAVEIGPFGGYVARHGFMWGGFVALGLGGSK